MLAVLPVVSRTPASGLTAHHQFHGIHGPSSSGDVPQQPSGFEPRGCAALGDRLHPHAVSNQVQRAPDQLNFFTHPQIVTSSDSSRTSPPFPLLLARLTPRNAPVKSSDDAHDALVSRALHRPHCSAAATSEHFCCLRDAPPNFRHT